jgi:hypothetical protein
MLQDPEMLGDGRPADRDAAGDVAHGALPASEELQNRPARGIAQGI